jgi:hypothetical protein
MNKLENKAQEYAQINDDKHSNVALSFSKYDIATAFQDGAEWMQKEREFAQRWIPIDEKHPELDILGMLVDPIIFKHNDGLIYISYQNFDFTTTTHWRPIELK